MWTHKAKFTGDTMYCQESNGDQIACYTTKMWPRQLQGILTIEPKVTLLTWGSDPNL